jgi:hypothetical protein
MEQRMMALSDIEVMVRVSLHPVFAVIFIMILPSINRLTALVLPPYVFIHITQLSRLLSFNYPHLDSLLISLIIKFLTLFSWFLFPFILLSTENSVLLFVIKSAPRDESENMFDTKSVEQLSPTFIRKTKLLHNNVITVS